MTYNEFIQNIIDTRGQWNIPDGEYYEKHHIIPKCMGGEGDFKNGSFKKKSKHQNCIWLYPGEHYFAHILLSIENPSVYGLQASVNFTTANGKIDQSQYIDIKKYYHQLPDFLLDNIRDAGEFRYNIRQEHVPKKDTQNYKKEQQRRRELGISGVKGSKNGMYKKGYKISCGNNGHASIRYFYKDMVFDSRKELIEYLTSQGITITSSAIRKIVHNTGTMRVYTMYKDVFDNLSWEYKDNNIEKED